MGRASIGDQTHGVVPGWAEQGPARSPSLATRCLSAGPTELTRLVRRTLVSATTERGLRLAAVNLDPVAVGPTLRAADEDALARLAGHGPVVGLADARTGAAVVRVRRGVGLATIRDASVPPESPPESLVPPPPAAVAASGSRTGKSSNETRQLAATWDVVVQRARVQDRGLGSAARPSARWPKPP